MARDAVNKIVDAEKMAAAGISEAREQARKIMADTEKVPCSACRSGKIGRAGSCSSYR